MHRAIDDPEGVIVARAHPRDGIIQRIRQMSGEMLEVEQGALYPALYRIERRDWVTSEWDTNETGRSAKFYKLTPQGKKQLTAEQDDWRRFSLAIEHVLEGA